MRYLLTLILFTATATVASAISFPDFSAVRVARNEGTPDSFFQNMDASTAILGNTSFGFGHGNRLNTIRLYDLSSLSNALQSGQSIRVTNATLTMTETDGLDYDGPISVHPVEVDWLSDTSEAAWDNFEDATPGYGSTVALGNRADGSTLAASATNPTDPQDPFNAMIADWINGSAPNHGLYVRTTGARSSWDPYATTLSFDTTVIPEPNTLPAILTTLMLGINRRR